jgi:glycosyltransferase involved in cell wall biosynthesis
MKSVAVYSPYWSTYGGGEKYVLLLAEALGTLPGVRVTLLADDPSVTMDALTRFANADLGAIDLRHIRSVAEATRGFDCAVLQSNFRRYPSRARRTVQLLQVPYAPITPRSVMSKALGGDLKESLKDVSRAGLMRAARGEGFDLVVANSVFVQSAVERAFGVRSEVLHPPIQDLVLPGVNKKKIILSVGRFFAGLYNEKRYDVLVSGFRRMSAELPGWEYHIAGSARDDRSTSALLETLAREGAGVPLVLHPNIPFDGLRRLYNEATIFWHAAGYGVDETLHPERVEHFGMTTVEAMSAGCIPVAVNRGGQREILTHGVDGYLWDSLDDLQALTVGIARGSAPADSLRAAARERAGAFFPDRFRTRVRELFAPILT